MGDNLSPHHVFSFQPSPFFRRVEGIWEEFVFSHDDVVFNLLLLMSIDVADLLVCCEDPWLQTICSRLFFLSICFLHYNTRFRVCK